MARKRLPKLEQALDPRTGRWQLFDSRTGRHLGTKASPGPYTGYPIRGETRPRARKPDPAPASDTPDEEADPET